MRNDVSEALFDVAWKALRFVERASLEFFKDHDAPSFDTQQVRQGDVAATALCFVVMFLTVPLVGREKHWREKHVC